MTLRLCSRIAVTLALALTVFVSSMPAQAIMGVYRSPESYALGKIYEFHSTLTDEEMEFVREHLIKLITNSWVSDRSMPVWEAWAEYQRLIEGRYMRFPDDEGDDGRPRYASGPLVSFAEIDLNDDGTPERFIRIEDNMWHLGADGTTGAMFHWRDGR